MRSLFASSCSGQVHVHVAVYVHEYVHVRVELLAEATVAPIAHEDHLEFEWKWADLMHLSLRPLLSTDLETVYRWRNDPEVTRHLARLSMTREQVETWFASLDGARGDRAYAIEADGVTVGYGVITDADAVNRKCEVGVILGEKTFWGRGIGTRVARELTSIAFSELGMHRVLAVASERNPASIACFTAVGYREEGRLRHANLREGEFIDLVLLSMLEPEWTPRRG